VSTENTDFAAVLSNMEAKRAALDAAISSLRAAIAAGALGVVASGDFAGIPVNPSLQGGEVPNGAFLGKTVSDAIKLLLAIVKKKQTTRQIVEALKRGGIESKSDKFGNIVYNSLTRMEKVTGEIAKLGKEWGLAEWYHPGIRNQSTPPVQSRRSTVTKSKATKQPAPQEDHQSNVEGLPSRIKELLDSHPNRVYGPTEIASALGVKPIAVNVRLQRMIERGLIVKDSPGKYQAAKSGVVKMPTAS
jgi:hypothetical protein